MKKILYFYLLTTMIFLALISCSKDNGTESLIEDKLESMSGKEMLRELLIKNDNDVNQLARIFDCSPSSLKRILEGETIATAEAKNQFKNTLNQTLITKEKTLEQLDPLKQTLSYKIKHFYENYYLWFIIFLLILGYFALLSIDEFGGMLYLIFVVCLILVYLITNIINWSKSDPIIVDNFKNTVDPIWELLK